MEVHAHSHSHGKKTWKNYFWEFLMLFLAVFCGFLAENFREHQVEKNRGRQYIVSLYEDLKIDREQLQNLIPAFEKKDKRLDTLLSLLKDVSVQKGANGLYNYFYEGTGYPDFVYTDRTITQLKNSGGLRLITNSKVSDSIIAYDAGVRLDNYFCEGINISLQQVWNLTDKLFDFSCCPNIGNVSDNYEGVQFPYPGVFNTYDKNTLVEYFNLVVRIKHAYNMQKEYLKGLLTRNNNLQDIIRKEYHVK